MSIPDFMPILSAGAHSDPSKGACAMELVSFLAGEEWSDSPQCTHPVLASMARAVNDRVSDEERQALLPLLTRLMGTASDDQRLSVGLAVWCAEQVVHLHDGPEAARALSVVRAWLAGDASVAECRKASAAAYAAAAYAAAAYAAAAYSAATAAANASGDLVALLTGLVNEYDRLTGRDDTTPLTTDDLSRLAALTH